MEPGREKEVARIPVWQGRTNRYSLLAQVGRQPALYLIVLWFHRSRGQFDSLLSDSSSFHKIAQNAVARIRGYPFAETHPGFVIVDGRAMPDLPVFGNMESTTWIVPRIFSLLFVPTRLIPSFIQNNVSTSRLIETFPSTCILDYRFLYGRNGCFSSTFEANTSRFLAPLLLQLNRNRFLPTRFWRKPGKSARSRAMSWFTRDSSARFVELSSRLQIPSKRRSFNPYTSSWKRD